MIFKGLAAPLSPTGLQSVCDALQVDAQTTWAVATVETRGCGFFVTRKPQMLFERHVFHRLTNHAFDQSDPDLSNSTPGGYNQPYTDQYLRLADAIELNEQAALQSASWGIGQVMGYNATGAGYASVDEMIAAFIDGEDAQLLATAEFIINQNLAAALQRQDWATFARGYNGPAYGQNDYDKKLQLAFARFGVGPPPDLRTRAVQVGLMILERLDANGVDGLFGKVTQAAIVQYQTDRGLPITGITDDATVVDLIAQLGWTQA